MVKLILVFATVAGIGSAEVHISEHATVEDCEIAVSYFDAYVDGDVKVTYHCVDGEIYD